MSTEPIDLAAAQALADAATPGPWSAINSGVANGDHWYVCDEGESIAMISANDGINEDQRGPDAEFIAQARTLVPALIAELREAREEADAERSLADFADAHVEDWKELALAAEATIARVMAVAVQMDLEQSHIIAANRIRAALEGGS